MLNISKSDLYNLYIIQGKSGLEIAKIYGCSISVVYKKLVSFEIQRRSISEAYKEDIPRRFKAISEDELYNLYIVQGMSGIAIAKLLKISHKTVYRKLEKMDVKRRNLEEANNKFPLSPLALKKIYIEENKTIYQIAELTNTSPSTVYVNLIRNDIQIKPHIYLSGEKNPSYGKRGKLSPNYKGSNSKKELKMTLRGSLPYKEWRKKIYERDSHTCRNCGDARGGNLNADHIVPFSYILKVNNITTLEEGFACKDLWSIENGITLCVTCHKKTATYGNKALTYKA